MHSENLTDALACCLELPDKPAAPDSRADFAARFAAELKRLEGSGAAVSAAEVDRLLGALGAAQVREWELALAFLRAAQRSPAGRRAPVALGTLRQRFQFVMSPGAEPPRRR